MAATIKSVIRQFPDLFGIFLLILLTAMGAALSAFLV